MNFLEDVEFNWMQFIGPLIVLIITLFVIVLVYKIFFSWLPRNIYNFLVTPVVFCGLYLWAFPMNLGFHEFFK